MRKLPWTYDYYASLPIKASRNPAKKKRPSKSKYHHIRVAAPHLFKKGGKIRTITFGKGIKARVAWRKGAKASTVQSLLFDPTRYTFAEAKRWAKSHGYKVLKASTPAAIGDKSAGKGEKPLGFRVRGKAPSPRQLDYEHRAMLGLPFVRD